MNELKEALRVKLKSQRLAIGPSEREIKSLVINDRLISATDWHKVSNIHIYEPIISLGEVNINRFINFIKYNYPKIKLFTTRQFNNRWQITALNDLSEVINRNFDVVIVPILGFDKSLNRIGYGGGYYDKFLSDQKNSFKIGVSFENGKVTNIHPEPHDVKLDIILTEAGIYH